MRIRIQLFTSVRIQIRIHRIQEAKALRIHANPDPLRLAVMRHTVQYLHTRRYKVYKAGNQVYLLILVNFLALDPDPYSQHGSGSRRAKSMLIRIQNTAHACT
jgi:hypothetical protein